MTRKSILSAAAVLLAGAAFAASAVSPAAAAGNDPAKPKQEQEQAQAAKADTRKYCMDTEATGSRILKRQCRTRAEWLDFGVDPIEMMKQR